MVTGGHLNRPPLIKLKSFGGLKCKYIYTQYFSLFSLWVSRYCYSQCSGGHITTASDRLQRKRPGSEAPQTHRAPPRDLRMNRTPSTRRQHINWARGKFQWSYSHWLQWEGHTVNKRERGCKTKKTGWMVFDSSSEGEEMFPPSRQQAPKLGKNMYLWSLTCLNQMENLIMFFVPCV